MGESKLSLLHALLVDAAHCTSPGHSYEPQYMKRERDGAMSEAKAVGKFLKGQRVLLNEDEFSDICEQMKEYDATRESIIKATRDVLKCSKQAIYSLHRSDMVQARKLLQTAEEGAKELLPSVQKDESLRHGSFANACEEYVEARTFEYFLNHGKLMTLKELEFVDRSEYLGGLADLTGEVTRYAVIQASKRDVPAVEHCKELVDALYGQLILFDFRNGSLRKKFDSVKWNLKKLETIIYELSLSGAGKVSAGYAILLALLPSRKPNEYLACLSNAALNDPEPSAEGDAE